MKIPEENEGNNSSRKSIYKIIFNIICSTEKASKLPFEVKPI